MSGIFGIIHLDGRPVEESDLVRMRDCMAHRGPDGSDLWLDGAVGLGQLMLCSTPESLQEALPWKDPESGLVITADARIDNREELLQKLGVAQAPASLWGRALPPNGPDGDPPAPPDSLIILAAYKRWGEACVEHLLGDFAFVIWNPRDKQLFCGRDHMGIRPFYYTLSDRVFVFASSALGVTATPVVPRRVREARIADFLDGQLEGVDKVCTWFQDVLRMPPAHFGVLSGRTFQQSNYWQPDLDFELELGSDEEYTEAFDAVLTDAIRARMRSNQPVASMLSGGLDSSTITGIARRIQWGGSGQPFACFSGVSDAADEAECRETYYSSLIIDQGGLDAHRFRPSDISSFADSIASNTRSLEDPFDIEWIHHRLLYILARHSGYRVVMDGIDGDGVAAITSTYPAYLLRAGQLMLAKNEIRDMCLNYHSGGFPVSKKFQQMVRLAWTPAFIRSLKRKLSAEKPTWQDRPNFINPEFAEKVELHQRIVNSNAEVATGQCGTLREAHATRITAPYVTAGLERYGRLAASCGIEQREPYQDLRVVEHCLSLPWQQLVRNGWSKIGLRRVAERVLPKEAAWRPGRESIMRKFWVEWYRLQPVVGKAVLPAVRSQLAGIIEYEAFEIALNHYRMCESDVVASIQNTAALATWLSSTIESAR